MLCHGFWDTEGAKVAPRWLYGHSLVVMGREVQLCLELTFALTVLTESNLMKISQRFEDRYLRAEDLSDPIVVTINSVDEVTIGDDERIIIEFSDCEKLLPLNKTNALNLAEMLGDDTDDWSGKRIEVYKEKVMFQGKRVPAVRVREPKQAQKSG